MSKNKYEKMQYKLYNAFSLLKNTDELSNFFKDLCTPSEIKAMVERFKVAILLYLGKLSYRQIHELTKVSIATTTRVARSLRHENYGGYMLIIQRLDEMGLLEDEITESNQADDSNNDKIKFLHG